MDEKVYIAGLLGCYRGILTEKQMMSLYFEEEDSRLGDFVPGNDIKTPPEAAFASLLREQILEVLDTLNERERDVLKLRFGLVDGHPRTLEEVGLAFNATRERIRQIEAKALRKLRHPTRIKKLKDYLE